MKIWVGYGSEHSMKLILIGQFDTVDSARAATKRIRDLQELAESEVSEPSWEPREEQVTEQFRQAMWDMGIYNMGRDDLTNFVYEYQIEQSGKELQIRTDESEIQGFLKVLLDYGAKVEIFSLHKWDENGVPRSDESSGD